MIRLKSIIPKAKSKPTPKKKEHLKLIKYVKNENYKKCLLAIKKVDNLNEVVDSSSRGLLHIAAKNGDGKILKLLLDEGLAPLCMIKSGEFSGLTPILIASKKGCLNIIKMLINNNPKTADCLSSGRFKGKSFLDFAIAYKKWWVLRYFYDKGYDSLGDYNINNIVLRKLNCGKILDVFDILNYFEENCFSENVIDVLVNETSKNYYCFLMIPLLNNFPNRFEEYVFNVSKNLISTPIAVIGFLIGSFNNKKWLLAKNKRDRRKLIDYIERLKKALDKTVFNFSNNLESLLFKYYKDYAYQIKNMNSGICGGYTELGMLADIFKMQILVYGQDGKIKKIGDNDYDIIELVHTIKDYERGGVLNHYDVGNLKKITKKIKKDAHSLFRSFLYASGYDFDDKNIAELRKIVSHQLINANLFYGLENDFFLKLKLLFSANDKIELKKASLFLPKIKFFLNIQKDAQKYFVWKKICGLNLQFINLYYTNSMFLAPVFVLDKSDKKKQTKVKFNLKKR